MKRFFTQHSAGAMRVLLFTLLIFMAAATNINAATYNEIISMNDAGVPPDIIIEVIEATGVESEFNYDAMEYLVRAGVHEDVINYLMTGDYVYEDSENQESDSGFDVSDHPNWAGGEGFHHSTGFTPRNDGNYRPEPYYRDDYFGRGPGITVYTPPVYMYNDHYNRMTYAPRYYRYDPYYPTPYTYTSPRNYHDGYYYTIPGYGYGYRYHDGYRYRDGWYGSFSGYWDYDNHNHHWDSRFSIGYSDEGTRFRISF